MIALIRFTGELTEADFTALDLLAAEARGNGHAFDCIFDMTWVTQVDLSPEFVALRGELPQAYPDRERIYVVGKGDLKLLTLFFAGYQARREQREPLVVETLSEAMQRLGVALSDFRPLHTEDRGAVKPARSAASRRRGARRTP